MNNTAFMLDDSYDVIVVGSGMTGSVIARYIAEELGKRVLVLEKRNHIAGNMYDFYKNGFLIQKYGPHTFHTNKEHLVQYLQRFGEWEPFFLECGAQIGEKVLHVPFNFETIDAVCSNEDSMVLKDKLLREYPDKEFVPIYELLKNKDRAIAEFAMFLYEHDFKPYSAKQWGKSPEEIDSSILRRVPIRLSYGRGYFTDAFQIMPKEGFTRIFENILNHEKIQVQTEIDASKIFRIKEKKIFCMGKPFRKMLIYTGPIDELLEYRYGELKYRSLDFKYRVIETKSFQKYPVVAYPADTAITRITEYTKLSCKPINGKTIIAYETPSDANALEGREPYYPLLSEEEIDKHTKYLSEIEDVSNLIACGRLAEFKYYNMDDALENALNICKKLAR